MATKNSIGNKESKNESERLPPIKLRELKFPATIRITGFYLGAGNYGDSLMFFRENEAPVSISSHSIIKQVKDNLDAFKGISIADVTIDKVVIKTGTYEGKEAYVLTNLNVIKTREPQKRFTITYEGK